MKPLELRKVEGKKYENFVWFSTVIFHYITTEKILKVIIPAHI